MMEKEASSATTSKALIVTDFWRVCLCALCTLRLGANVQGEVHLCKSVNAFAFVAFLFANVLTGVVNSTLNTLVAGTTVCILTLTA